VVVCDGLGSRWGKLFGVVVGAALVPMGQGAGPEGWRLGSNSGEPPGRLRARQHRRRGTSSRPGHSGSKFVEGAVHTCRRTRPSHQPSYPWCAQASTCTGCLRPEQRQGASTLVRATTVKRASGTTMMLGRLRSRGAAAPPMLGRLRSRGAAAPPEFVVKPSASPRAGIFVEGAKPKRSCTGCTASVSGR
jgi:hypothetical protein